MFAALASDALAVDGRHIDDFADEMGFEKPSQAIRAYESCQKTLDWLKNDMQLMTSEISDIAETLDNELGEVKEEVERVQAERKAKHEFEHPPVPEGFTSIEDLQASLDLGEYGDRITDYTGNIGDAFGEIADSEIDIYTHDLLKWLPDNYEWLEEADAQGLLEGCKGDLIKMTQMAQYECFTQDMYSHQEDIAKYAALEGLASEGVYALADKVYDDVFDGINDAPDEVRACWDESTGIWDDLYEAGYTGIDMNLDDLLSRSSFNVNLFFATETEKNFDMGSIVDSFGNDYREPRLEDIDAESLDNALSYLVNQQGHSVEEVFGNPDNAFIHSIREEIDENSSEAMSELCALVRMDAREMLDLIGKRSEAKGSLVLPRDCATMGIFNQWSGCGGVLDILLEKDAVMPLSMIRGFQIEGQSDPEGYTVNDVYGLVGSCWKPAQLSDDIETDVKEDYALALQKARATGWEIEEQEAAEPVSLKAAVKESRAASEALVAHGASAVDLEHEADNARTAASPLSKPDGDR